MKQEQLRGLLCKPAFSGIYHLPSSGLAALQEACTALEYPCFKTDLQEATDMAVVLTALGDALGFPAWYGANLDALKDCLTDFSWHDAPGYVLIISGADALHADCTLFANLNAVFSSTIEEWREHGIPFWVFYDMRADGLAALPTLA